MEKHTLERRITRARKRVEEIKARHGDNPSMTHTYHAGWSLGYWVGRLGVYEDMYEDIFCCDVPACREVEKIGGELVIE